MNPPTGQRMNIRLLIFQLQSIYICLSFVYAIVYRRLLQK